MRTAGIILLVIGILSFLGGIMAAVGGHNANFSGLIFIVLGAFLLSRANKKKEEEEKKKNWTEGNSFDKE